MIALVYLPFVLIGLLLFYNFYLKRRGLPPGPVPWPFIGNVIEMRKNAPAHKLYMQWCKKYGPIYTIWIGEVPLVLVSEFELLKDTFVKDGQSYVGRNWQGKFYEALPGVNEIYGVASSEGERWQVTRRFALKALRDLGMGRNILEEKMLADLGELLLQLEQKTVSNKSSDDNGGIVLKPLIDLFSGNVIYRLMFGCAFEGERIKKFYELKQTSQNVRNLFGTAVGRMVVEMPWLRHIPPFSYAFEKRAEAVYKFYDFFNEHINERTEARRNGKPPELCNDLLDFFLVEMERIEKDDNEVELRKHFTIPNLRGLCLDLYNAGQETTSLTIGFLVLYLLLDQHSQQRVHKELDAFIETEEMNKPSNEDGLLKEWQIRYSDRAKLPFLCAVINETQRMVNLLPLLLPSRTTRDVTILGYKIPAETSIVPQISTVFQDEKIFPDPDKYRPERFLDENGQSKKCDQIVPFGMGKRQCMGESVARMELFLFAANFFNKFSVYPVNPLDPPSAKAVGDFASEYIPYQCRLEIRKFPIKLESANGHSNGINHSF